MQTLDTTLSSSRILDVLQAVDYVPLPLPPSSGLAQLLVLEDNAAVIKMCNKGRSAQMRHVVRTQRIDIDWLFERVRDDPGVFMKYVRTQLQLADVLTKASFTSLQWRALCTLCSLGPKYDTRAAEAEAGLPKREVRPHKTSGHSAATSAADVQSSSAISHSSKRAPTPTINVSKQKKQKPSHDRSDPAIAAASAAAAAAAAAAICSAENGLTLHQLLNTATAAASAAATSVMKDFQEDSMSLQGSPNYISSKSSTSIMTNTDPPAAARAEYFNIADNINEDFEAFWEDTIDYCGAERFDEQHDEHYYIQQLRQ